MSEQEELKKRLVEMTPGTFVERDVLNVVDSIRYYDPNLDVMYLDPRFFTSPNEAPYRIVERCADGNTRLVFDVWELDERVLERIRLADNKRYDILGRIDDTKQQILLGHKRRYEERMGEAHDIAYHVLRNPKTTYTFKNEEDEKIKIVDNGEIM